MPFERPREAPQRWRLDRLVGGPRHGERVPWVENGLDVRFPVSTHPPGGYLASDVLNHETFSYVRYTRRYWGCPAGMLVFYAFDEMTEEDVEREMWRVMMLGIGAELDE